MVILINIKAYIEIKNLDTINLNEMILYFMQAQKKGNKLYSVGGRVLNFISISDNFAKAKENIIKNLNTLNWSDGFYRRDIGYKVIK